MNILIALIVFSILVLFHEFGHFIMAKAVGIGVTEFSLGLGPRIFSFGKGETKYSLKAIPFGGSCAMVGEDEEDTSPNAFYSKSVWARLLVVVAGPLFNIILAFLLSLFLVGFGGINTAQIYQVTKGSAAEQAGITIWEDSLVAINGKKITMGRELMLYLLNHPLGDDPVTVTVRNQAGEERTLTLDTKISGFLMGISYLPSQEPAALSEISAGSAAEKAGLKAGDVIVGINGTTIGNGVEMEAYLSNNPFDGSPLALEVLREGQQISLTLTPEAYEGHDLGFQAYYVYDEWDGNLLTLAGAALREVRFWLHYTLVTLKMLFSGQLGVKELSGPVGIVNTIGMAVESGMESGGAGVAALNVLTLTVVLSANLGVMNLFPFPALDGGRILFMIFEIIFRKPLPRKVEGAIHMAGFALLMLLMIFVLVNDILRLFT